MDQIFALFCIMAFKASVDLYAIGAFVNILKSLQEVRCLPMIVKDNHFYMTLLGEQCVVILPVLPVEAKHIAIEGKRIFIQAFYAATAHILPCLTVALKNTFRDTPKAYPSGQIKENYGVTVVKPVGKRSVKIAVNDPSWLLKLCLQQSIKVLPGSMLPAAAPIKSVQMQQGQFGLFR